jgi:putative FmdB family regulatory protein
MPIYAYKCESCGHCKDVLQKVSDPLLAVCPACGEASFVKQLTAAGFQLKGSGWYATDFRGGNKPGEADAGKPKTADEPAAAGGNGASAAPAAAAASDAAATRPATPAAAAPPPAKTP